MIRFYKSLGGIFEVDRPETGGWTNVINPAASEIVQLTKEYHVPDDLIQDILDTDERPRLEYDDDWTLLILRIPIQITAPLGVPPFITIPLGIYITTEQIITICGSDNEVLPSEQPSLYRGQHKQVKDLTNFILNLFLRSAKIYLKYLKQINHQSTQIEKELERSIRNEELHRLLNMEKSLVYFFTSLRGNELLLSKFKNSRLSVLNETNEDLLEDAVIENKQAVDMVQIYSDIQSGMMDTFASVISNNLNVVMKRLTSVSIILMIPTLISSIYGMNVTNYLENPWWAFPAILSFSAFASISVMYIFKKQKFF
jgi:magnesium transporter